MRKKSLREFVKEHREEITNYILSKCSNCKVTLEELENWVKAGDEGLYRWARHEGVNI